MVRNALIIFTLFIVSFSTGAVGMKLLSGEREASSDVAPADPLQRAFFGVLDHNGFEEFGDLRFQLSIEPSSPQKGEDVRFVIEVSDREGNLAALDNSIHNSRMHMYALRDDLKGGLLHVHPNQGETGEWIGRMQFPSAGLWHLIMQTAKDGALYHITGSLLVGGEPDILEDYKFSKEGSRRGEYVVRFHSVPATLKAGENTRMEILIEDRMGQPLEIPKEELYPSHNVIFARKADPLSVWNEHGDGSVRDLSPPQGLLVERVNVSEKPFTYEVTFPRPGIWLVYVELPRVGAESFYINVL